MTKKKTLFYAIGVSFLIMFMGMGIIGNVSQFAAISPLAADDFLEPNNTYATAKEIDTDWLYELSSEDQDWFKFTTIVNSPVLTIFVEFDDLGGTVNIDVQLYYEGPLFLAENLSLGNDASINYSPELGVPAGNFYVRVVQSIEPYTPTPYNLTVSYIPDDFLENNDDETEASLTDGNTVHEDLKLYDNDVFNVTYQAGLVGVFVDYSFKTHPIIINTSVLGVPGDSYEDSDSDGMLNFTFTTDNSVEGLEMTYCVNSLDYYDYDIAFTFQADDGFEDNDDAASAAEPEQNQVYSNLKLFDDDYFNITYAEKGIVFVSVDYEYTTSDPTILIECFEDAEELVLNCSDNDANTDGKLLLKIFHNSDGDLELMFKVSSPKTYEYNLTIEYYPDDDFEENDIIADFKTISMAMFTLENPLLVLIDNDFYGIYLNTGDHFTLDIALEGAFFPVSANLIDVGGVSIWASDSDTENLHLEYDIIATGLYYIHVSLSDVDASCVYYMSFARTSSVTDDTLEQNDGTGSSDYTVISGNQAYTNLVLLDTDAFKIALTAGQTLTIAVSYSVVGNGYMYYKLSTSESISELNLDTDGSITVDYYAPVATTMYFVLASDINIMNYGITFTISPQPTITDPDDDPDVDDPDTPVKTANWGLILAIIVIGIFAAIGLFVAVSAKKNRDLKEQQEYQEQQEIQKQKDIKKRNDIEKQRHI